MEVAKQLGLTEGLEELDANSELTRGQMVQILYNMLYCEINGTSFAQKNFGLEEKVYVLVATNTQYMIGAERVEKKGYVALAALNADGTYSMKDQLHFAVAELGLTQDEADLKVGYSYTVASYDKFYSVYSVEENATETFQNYGDKITIKSANGYNQIENGKHISINGKTYELVTSYSELNNKYTYQGNYNELIVHSALTGTTQSSFQYYIYNDKFDILDANGNVALMYNHWTGSYYYNLGNGMYRPATEEDFAQVAINVVKPGATDTYNVVTSNSVMNSIKFSQITMIDDNGDGTYDRGIYVPYSVGKYTTTNSDEKVMWSINASKSSKQKTTSPLVNGEYLWYYASAQDGKWYSVGHVTTANKFDKDAYVKTSDIRFLGDEKPASGEYVVYYYNPASRIFYVVENLGAGVEGTVQTMNQGAYAYDTTTKTYYYKDATVTINNETYKLGYRPQYTFGQFLDDDAYDLAAIDEQIAYYAWDDELYGALIGQTYKSMTYVVLAGHVIYLSDAGNDCGWIAFDMGKDLTPATSPKIADYEGDIIGVDADGNILVSAFVDTSGEKTIAKIGSINGFNYGLLVEDYAALNYQFSGVGILGTNSYETMKKLVILSFFEQLTADLQGQTQYMFVVTGVDADGVYTIYTDLDLYWPNNNTPWYQPKDYVSKQTAPITFIEGLSTTKHYIDGNKSGKTLKLTDETIIAIAGKDDFKVQTGVPANGATLNFSIDRKDTAGNVVKTDKARAYVINDKFILVASKDMTCDEIFTFAKWDVNNTTAGYTYYMVLGTSDRDSYEANTTAYATFDGTKYTYTYKDLYNINEGKLATKTLSTPLEYYDTAYNSIPFGYNQPKPLGAIYAEKNGVFTLINDPEEIKTVTSGSNYNQVNHKYFADCVEVLDGLLYSGYTTVSGKTYAPIYESIDMLGAKSSTTANVINLVNAGTKYDPYVTFAFDVITYAGSATSAKVTLAEKKSTDNYAGAAIYYDYDINESFVATVISAGSLTPDNSDRVLNDAKADAIAALEAVAPTATATAAYVKYAKLINAATSVAEVDALTATAVVEIAKELGVADYTLRQAAIVDAVDAIKAVADDPKYAGLKIDGKTLDERVADYKAWYENTAMFADALSIRKQSPIDVEYFTAQCEKALADKNAADQAEQDRLNAEAAKALADAKTAAIKYLNDTAAKYPLASVCCTMTVAEHIAMETANVNAQTKIEDVNALLDIYKTSWEPHLAASANAVVGVVAATSSSITLQNVEWIDRVAIYKVGTLGAIVDVNNYVGAYNFKQNASTLTYEGVRVDAKKVRDTDATVLTAEISFYITDALGIEHAAPIFEAGVEYFIVVEVDATQGVGGGQSGPLTIG